MEGRICFVSRLERKDLDLPTSLSIKNVDEVIELRIKKGDKFILKGIGDFEVSNYFEGNTAMFIDLE